MSDVRVVKENYRTVSFHQLMTRILLIGSFIVFAAGATGPALGGFWGMSLEDGARWIAANPGTWTVSTILFIVSLFLCVSGLAGFNDSVQRGEAHLLAKAGFLTFSVGALFWIMDMSFRLSVELWAARIFVETSTFPNSYTPLRLLQSTLGHMFMVSTLLASSVYGLALLRSPQFPRSLGWFALGYGLLVAASYAVTRGPIPIMVLVVPLVLGMSPFTAVAASEQRWKSEKP